MSTLLKNTASNSFMFVVRLALTFLMTPIYIRALGDYDYGIWEMMVATVGYLGILDLGLRPAVARFAAHYAASGTRAERQQLYATALLSLFVIGALGAGGLSVWAMYSGGSIGPEGSDPARYANLIFLFAVQVLISFPAYVFASFLDGYQRYVAKNNVALVITLLKAVAFVVLQDGRDPLLLLIMITLAGLLVRCVCYAAMLKFDPRAGLTLSDLRGNLSMAKELFRFGFKSSIQGASGVISTRSDVIIVGAVLGPAQVVFYTLAAAVARYTSNLRMILTHATMPAFAALNATSRRDDARTLYRRGSLYTLAIFLPICVGGILLGSDFIGLWIGPEYGTATTLVLPMLLVHAVVTSIMPLSSRYLTAINRHGIFARIFPWETAAHVAISLMLVHVFGITGVVLGAVIASSIFLVPIVRSVSRALDYSFAAYFKDCVTPFILPVVALSGAVSLVRAYAPPTTYGSLLLGVIVGALVYGSVLSITLPRPERKVIFGTLLRLLPVSSARP